MADKSVATKAVRRSDATESQVRPRFVPRYSLRQALAVAQAITDNFAGKRTLPNKLPMALNLSPTSSTPDSLLASSAAYGLTKGSRKANRVELTELGRRATAPAEEGDDVKAKAEAALKPDVHNKFFTRYNR